MATKAAMKQALHKFFCGPYEWALLRFILLSCYSRLCCTYTSFNVSSLFLPDVTGFTSLVDRKSPQITFYPLYFAVFDSMLFLIFILMVTITRGAFQILTIWPIETFAWLLFKNSRTNKSCIKYFVCGLHSVFWVWPWLPIPQSNRLSATNATSLQLTPLVLSLLTYASEFA